MGKRFDQIFRHIFHDRASDSNMYFCMPEETTKGLKIHVRPTRSIRFSRYQIMVNYLGVRLLANTTLRHNNRGKQSLKNRNIQSPLSTYMLFCIICLLSLLFFTLLGLNNYSSTQEPRLIGQPIRASCPNWWPIDVPIANKLNTELDVWTIVMVVVYLCLMSFDF